MIILTTVKPEELQNKDVKGNNNNIKAYISNIKITWVAESAPLGISKTKSLYDAMVRQSLFLCCRDTCVREVVPCKISTGKTCLE